MTELILTYDEWLEAAKASETYHYPNRDHRTIGPFGSGATLKTDGEKIVGRVEAPAFKVGSFYRQSGDVCRVDDSVDGVLATVSILDDGKWVQFCGLFRLADGKYTSDLDSDVMHLLPGELVQRDGQWVAMEEAAPVSMTPEAAFDDAVRRARESMERMADQQMLDNDLRQPTARERGVMARINLAKSLAADWEAAKKQPALAHPYPFARNFQG